MISLATPAELHTLPPFEVGPPNAEIVELTSRLYGQAAMPTGGLPFRDRPTAANSKTVPSATNPVRPFISSAKTAPTFVVDGMKWFVLAPPDQTGGAYSLSEIRAEATAAVADHTHADNHEAIYVLDGTLTLVFDDRIDTLTPGAFAYLPRGTRHAWTVNTPVQLLVWRTPGLRMP